LIKIFDVFSFEIIAQGNIENQEIIDVDFVNDNQFISTSKNGEIYSWILR